MQSVILSLTVSALNRNRFFTLNILPSRACLKAEKCDVKQIQLNREDLQSDTNEATKGKNVIVDHADDTRTLKVDKGAVIGP